MSLGFEVEFVLMSATGEFLSDVRRDFSVYNLNVQQARFIPFPLARYLRNRRPDALIANMWPLTSASVIGRALSARRCSLLLVDHCSLSSQYATWGYLHNFVMRVSIKATYRWANQIASVSMGSAIDMAQIASLPLDRVKVLHNPIPKRKMPSAQAITEADLRWNCSKGGRILTVGSFKDQKNHALLLRAFALIPNPDARLMFLGQGDNETMLRNQADELGIAKKVIFAGFQIDPSPYYLSADLFALSSDYEGLPTVLIESLSFGLPVVSTDCPSGPSEILENGRWGWLVKVGDVIGLAKAIDEALIAKIDCEALKRRADDFAPEIAARKYLDLLGLA